MEKLRALITNGAMIVLSVLMFVFMSQPFLTVSVTMPIVGTQTVKTSGYDYLENISKLSGNDKFVAVAVLFVIILASLLILVALTNLLVNFGFVKNATVAKVLPYVETVLALLAVVFTVAALGVVAKDVANTPAKVGWGLIVTLVVSAIALGVAVFDMLLAFKKSK